jgi:NAD(P)-dependent dehydrogenase (short-subunit alcohol dehydrogenase family)
MPLVWLITGCSSGFGLSFASAVLARGDLVIATARNPSTIQHLAAQGADVLQLDLTWSQQDIDAVVAAAIAVHGRVDVLLNNAGYIQVGLWEDLEYEDWLRQFDTNVFGTIKVTKAMLPHMRTRKQGTMVFVTSLTGFVGHPTVGAYAASKHAVEGREGLSKWWHIR